MTESFNHKEDKRVIFPPGEQHKFLLKAFEKAKCSWSNVIKKIGANKRTFSDWRSEKYSMPLTIAKQIADNFDIPFPSNLEFKNRYWYVGLGGSAGAKAVIKKYGRVCGDPEHRKKKWREWWEREGKYRSDLITAPKSFLKPKYSKELAEFVGIIMGDGGITKNQVTVSLNSRDDKEYAYFIKELIARLFNVPVSITYPKDQLSLRLLVSRVGLVNFCRDRLGLKVGNKLKQNLDVPEWVKKKKSFKLFYMRGLMDTDGCIFNECHKIGNKKYCYPKMSFVSASQYLLSSVHTILKELGFAAVIRGNRSVQLERRQDVINYFRSIGTNNLKHKKRFETFIGGVGSGCPKRF